MNKFLSLIILTAITIVTSEESWAENNLACPQTPQIVQTDWLWYECNHNIANDPFFTHTGLDMPMSFTTPKDSDFTAANPARLLISLHKNDRGKGKFVTRSNSFRYHQNEVEIHDQEDSYLNNPDNSLWGFSGAQSGLVENYNGRRIAASIDYVLQRFGNRIDLNKGLHLKGKKFGGTGAIIQAMILPSYQDKIAIVEASTGHMLLAKCCQDLVTPAWGANRFDEADFRLQLDKIKNIHFHWEGKSNNAAGQFDLEFFNLCEQFKISCSGVWRQAGVRVRLPKKIFLDNKQDVTLDRILPVITNSSANHHDPLQGHHNRGISWDHANITETPTRIEIPLKYKPKRNIGDNIPDQPDTVTFSVTPRHLQSFQSAPGATIDWQFGTQMGSASVDSNGLVSIDGLSLSALANYQTLIMDLQTNTSANGIVYVRVPRTHGQYVVQLRDGSDYTLESPDVWDRLPDSARKFGGFNAPGQLIYQAPDGSEQILYDCLPFTEPCVPLDPSVSFDGEKVLFSVYRGRQFNNAWWEGTTLPNLQLGQPYEAQLHVVEISTGQVTALTHNPGDTDFTPVWLPDGRIMFASTRAGTRIPWIDRMSPPNRTQPQLYIAEADGSNAINISPHELATAMHPYVLNNGRIAYSSHWLSHNLAFVGGNGGINFFTTISNMWMVTDTNRDGGDTTALLGAHRSHSFRDATTARTKTFKALHFLGQRGNNDICATNYYRGNNLGMGDVFCWPPEAKGIEGQLPSFLPRNIYNVASWSKSNDESSIRINGIFQGKIGYPEGIENNQLMLTVAHGKCFSAAGTVVSLQDDVANQPGKLACDAGIYKTTQIPSTTIDDITPIVDRPEWHEFAARTVKPRVVNMPPTNITNGGTCLLSSSDAGTAETTPHFPFEFNNNFKTSANHGGQIDGINHDELWGMRFWEVIPNQGQRPANLRSSIGNELKYLGDAPLLADKSFVVELPCDTPYIMAGIDNGGNVIMRDQIPQSLRPGEERVCTGCHLHSQSGRPYDQSMAYTAPPRDLTVAQAVPTFEQTIKPILQQHCVSCHTNTTNGDDDIALLDYDKLVWDFFQTSVPLAKRIPGARGGFGLHRPYTSKYVNNMFARESLLYWKAANQRLDARTDATYPDDIDFGLDHPSNISAQELKTLGLWLDSGAPR